MPGQDLLGNSGPAIELLTGDEGVGEESSVDVDNGLVARWCWAEKMETSGSRVPGP